MNTKPNKGSFSADNQPAKRGPRRRSARSRILEAMEGMTFKDENNNDIPLTESNYLQTAIRQSFREDSLMREILSRLVPQERAQLALVEFEFNEADNPTQRMDKLLAAVARGDVHPDTAHIIGNMIHDAAKIAEISDIVDRLQKLEQLLNGGDPTDGD
ncbi:TPA: hypothetical protein QHN36_003571 [Enterobacter bugandensis]|nr:hypothetical protein [Enterobacter bugandensis]